MNCVNHGTRNGVNTCCKCGNWLCEDCTIDIDGRVVCKRCVTELINSGGGHHGHGGHHARHDHEEYHRHLEPEDRRMSHYEHVDRGPSRGGRRISWFWLFVISFIMPGANYMFMGLIKRGIYAMCAFLLSFYCAIELGMPLLGILTAVIYMVSIFDGFKVRRMLLDGEYVEDGFSGVINALFRHKLAVGIVALLLIFSNFFSRTVSYAGRMYGMPYSSISSHSSIIFILLVAAAVFYFFIKPRRRVEKEVKEVEEDYIDKRQQ